MTKTKKEKVLDIKLGEYRHFKGGRYLVLGVGKHSETGEEFVVYQALDGESIGKLWIRPVSMFMDNIERDGYSGPRFIPD